MALHTNRGAMVRPRKQETGNQIMSAWLCSEEHISLIVNAIGGNEKQFKMLVKENIRSLSARYPGRDFLADWKREAKAYRFQKSFAAIDRTQVVKSCDSYDYQACETDNYRETEAAAYVEMVRRDAINQGGKSEGAEYDRADWSL
jgi:hypothetical protein